MKKLIIHIGTGKTGISSIRTSATASISNLSKNNIFYLGKFFERSPDPSKRANNSFHKGAHWLRDQWDVSKEKIFHQTLNDLILKEPDGSTFFILNESLHHLHHPFASSLKAFEVKTGIKIKIKSYARSHGNYSVSAYKQWGLKHKTNIGPTMSYTEWCKKFERIFICYGRQLKAWKEIYGDDMTTYNYDQIDNVALHFQNILREESNQPHITMDKSDAQSNQTPCMDRLILHALANHGIQQQALPAHLEKVLKRHPLPQANLANLELNSLIPTSQEIEAIITSNSVKEDQTIVNDLLKDSNEKLLFNSSDPNTDTKTPNGEHILLIKALSNLLNVLISQDQTIAELEKNIQQLHERIDKVQDNQTTSSTDYDSSFLLYSRHDNHHSE